MKKLIAVILILVMVLGTVPVLAQEDGNTYFGEAQFYNRLSTVTFHDLAYLPVDHWSSKAIYTMTLLGLLKGSDGNFNPTDTATRSEALAVLFRAAGMESEASEMQRMVELQRQKNPNIYNTIDQWADGYLRLAVDKNLITIDEFMSTMDRNYAKNPDPLFAKDKPVTRKEIARWIVILFQVPMAEKENLILDFVDYQQIPESDRLYMETAVRNGILKGSEDRLMPNDSITREQLAQMFYNILDLLLETQQITKKTAVIDDISVQTFQEDGKIRNETTIKAGNDIFIAKRQYDLIGEAVDLENINYENQYEDFVVLADNHLPSDTSLLKKADKIEYYLDQTNQVLFLSKLGDEVEFTYREEDYEESKVYVGKLYLFDQTEQTVIIENDGEYTELPYLENLEFYNRNTRIPEEEINLKWLDCDAYLFTIVKKTGGVDRVYRIQMLK